MLKFAILAALLQLAPGYNNVGQSGEVVAVQAATSNATATVQVKAVDALTTYTNTTAQVVKYEPAWRVTVTNYAPFVGFLLPAEYFPITYINGDEEVVTVSDASSLVYYYDVGGEEVHVSNNTGLDINFYQTPPYLYAGTDSEGVTFAGAEPISEEWPRLEYVNNPASYTTNVVGYLDYSYFNTANSHIIGEPVRFDLPITNTVVTGQAISGYYAATNDIGSVTTSAHFGQAAITNKVPFGGGILVEGAAEGDTIKLILK